jgi:hypothetical protein
MSDRTLLRLMIAFSRVKNFPQDKVDEVKNMLMKRVEAGNIKLPVLNKIKNEKDLLVMAKGKDIENNKNLDLAFNDEASWVFSQKRQIMDIKHKGATQVTLYPGKNMCLNELSHYLKAIKPTEVTVQDESIILNGQNSPTFNFALSDEIKSGGSALKAEDIYAEFLKSYDIHEKMEPKKAIALLNNIKDLSSGDLAAILEVKKIAPQIDVSKFLLLESS